MILRAHLSMPVHNGASRGPDGHSAHHVQRCLTSRSRASGLGPIDFLPPAASFASHCFSAMTHFGGNLNYCGGLGCGVVFKLAPNSNGGWKETVLHRFADHPGAYPNSVPRSTFRPLHLDTPSGRPDPLLPLPGTRFAAKAIVENHIFVQLWRRISSGELVSSWKSRIQAAEPRILVG
jgi:hypothetical protein